MYVEDPKEDELRQQRPQTSKSKQKLQCLEDCQTSGECDEENCIISS